MAASLSEQLGQQVIVENVGGGGGMTGAARVAKAPPDGSQFVLGNVGTHAVSQSLSENPPYRVAADFAPVALFADLSLVLVTRKDLPANNLQEFIAYAKANQDKMQFASASAGSATHLGCALLNAAIGVNVTHIPYRGGGPAMQDMVAGRIDYICIDTPAVDLADRELARSRRWRSSSQRPHGEPAELPTAQEQGLANFEAANWAAFFMPKGTPAPIVARLQSASAAAVGSEAVVKRMKEIGVDPVAPDAPVVGVSARSLSRARSTKWARPGQGQTAWRRIRLGRPTSPAPPPPSAPAPSARSRPSHTRRTPPGSAPPCRGSSRRDC